MDDVFARIGRAFAHLKANSTMVGAPAEEVSRLAHELETFEAGINAQIQELVQRATETAVGRILVLEERINELAAGQASVDAGLDTLAASLESDVAEETPPALGTEVPTISGEILPADPAPVAVPAPVVAEVLEPVVDAVVEPVEPAPEPAEPVTAPAVEPEAEPVVESVEEAQAAPAAEEAAPAAEEAAEV